MELYNGDCLEIMKTIPDKSVDFILCDLPYGTTACKWDSIIPFEELWEQYTRITKENSVIALFSTQPFTTKVINSNINNFKYTWYWKKNNVTGFAFAKYQPLRCIEDICIFYKHVNYRPQGLIKLEKAKKSKRGNIEDDIYDATLTKEYVSKYTNFPKQFLVFKNEFGLHPTQKPVALLEYLIKTYTDEGQTVLDNCMGSGSTGVACINTNRKFIGIEKDNKYFEIAKERIQETERSFIMQ